MKKARNAPVVYGSDIWRLLGEGQRRRSQAMLSAILGVQLRQPLVEARDSFERQLDAHEDQRGETIPDEILAVTVIARTDIVTVAQTPCTERWHS